MAVYITRRECRGSLPLQFVQLSIQDALRFVNGPHPPPSAPALNPRTDNKSHCWIRSQTYTTFPVPPPVHRLPMFANPLIYCSLAAIYLPSSHVSLPGIEASPQVALHQAALSV